MLRRQTRIVLALPATAAVLAGLVASSATATVAPAPDVPAGTELVADGLANPRGVVVDAEGNVWIAEAGGLPPADSAVCLQGPEGNEVCYNATGAVTRVATDGTSEQVLAGLSSIGDRATGANATGPHDLAVADDGTVYLLFGLGADPATRAENEAGGPGQLGRLYSVDVAAGELTEVADIAGFETTENPDGGLIDSNPFALVALADGGLAVTDAGANALYGVAVDGSIATLAVFADREEAGPDGSAIPMNAVPDGLAIDADGNLVVGQLTGFPFPVDGANVYGITDEGEPEAVAEGFTNIIDVAVGPDGALYVLEYVSGGLLSVDPADPATLAGTLYRVVDGGEPEVVVEGLTTPTGVAVGADGAIYVTNNGATADAGQLLVVTG